ncbi:glycoside hydrolase family 3 protein [Arthrobacter bambusae]|uniref:glycoside hydrolase family 3 protein n=1 Tax=Arthrobacter bambusae TaxID=1338426 RepID=UPI00277E5178|nr:glycoside hydrolase family 3 N-terminal domain-containing protein [Arthrobacter bambusae]MDQ0031644.1 beta-N-acetylhexosaminidase [Arthrobacter bambusae]MDQ0099868.1 beta-N-acetylhexosaminidase [Arthrobacter bambusae]
MDTIQSPASQSFATGAARAHLRRLAAGTLMPGFTGIAVPVWILEAYDAGLAAVCIYGTNVASPVQLRELCAGLRAHSPNTLIAVDEEGGDVTRLHYLTGSTQPGNAVLGRLDDVELTAASASAIGHELAGLGINLNLAPDADVNSAPDNPVIGVRSFGAEPDLVARHTAAWIRGLEDAGVASCAKHFPGHGDTSTDSHLALPRVTADAATLDARELVPFRALVAAGGATVMTSHILVEALDPDHPATFSSRILQDLLRRDMGFDGVIITDALDMAGASAQTGIPEAAVRSLIAGADLLCLGSETGPALFEQTLTAIAEAVEEGRLPLERLEDAVARTAALSSRFPAAGAAEIQEAAIRGQLGGSGRAPVAGVPDDSITLDGERITEAFEVSGAAESWLARKEPVAIVQVETGSNFAVGRVPWGPAATAAAVVRESEVPDGARVAVVGRGLDAEHPLWTVFARLRAEGHAVIAVECGWPRGGADIVTYGASLTVSQALTALLNGSAKA